MIVPNPEALDMEDGIAPPAPDDLPGVIFYD